MRIRLLGLRGSGVGLDRQAGRLPGGHMTLQKADLSCAHHPKSGPSETRARPMLAVDDEGFSFLHRQLIAPRQDRIEGYMHRSRDMSLGILAR